MVEKEQIIDALKTVYDPEIPVNIWDLGLIYDIRITNHESRPRLRGDDKTKNHGDSDGAAVKIAMTMTSPTCPMSEEILEMARTAVAAIPGVTKVDVNLVWDPPWDISKMSTVARIELDLTEMGW